LMAWAHAYGPGLLAVAVRMSPRHQAMQADARVELLL